MCESLGPVLSRRVTKIERAVNEMISLLLVTEVEELHAQLSSASAAPRPNLSRRGSMPAVQFNLIPGEKAAMKQRQQKEELRQDALYLYQYFYQKTINSLIQTTRSNLDSLRRALAPPSALGYTDASDDKKDRKPVFKVQVTLAIPSIVLKPGLEDIQTLVSDIVHTIVAVHKEIGQWGAATADPLAAPSQQAISTATEKKVEPRTVYKMVYENKEVAKLTTALSSIVTAAKKTIIESFDHFSLYQDLWVTEQEKVLQEFLDDDPLLGDFEAKIHYYEEVEAKVMEEVDQLQVGAFCLDTCELVFIVHHNTFCISMQLY